MFLEIVASYFAVAAPVITTPPLLLIIVSAEPVKPALAELLVIVIETVGLQSASIA